MLNKRYIKSIKRDIFCFDFLSSFNFFSAIYWKGKGKKWFKRDIIVLISFLILFVSISVLVNIGKEMSFPGFRKIGILFRPDFTEPRKGISFPIFIRKEIETRKVERKSKQKICRLIDRLYRLNDKKVVKTI